MTDLRRVRRVSLRAPSEALARRGALLLEDALRTASWPAAVPGRVIAVRRFDAGVIHPDESPAALSARIEERLRDLGARLVHALAPAAAGADAVYFRDRVEAAVMLAEHAARTSAPAPWFVGRAVPAYRPEAGPRHAQRSALAAALDASPEGGVALVEALLARGTAGPLLDALEGRDGPVLLAALGISAAGGDVSNRVPEGGTCVPGEPADVLADGSPVLEGTPPVLEGTPPVLEDGTPVLEGGTPVPEGGSDVLVAGTPVLAGRSGVLAGRSGVLAGPSGGPAGGPPVLEPGFGVPDGGAAPRAPEPALPDGFRAALAERAAAWGPSDARSVWLAAAALLARSPGLRHDPRFAERAAALARSHAGRAAEGAIDRRGAPARERAPSGARAASASTELPPEGAWSAWGGLLFLVPLLERLGLPTFLAEHPALAEAAFPLHLLLDVARRLDAPPDDPIVRALGLPPAPLPDAAFTEPAALALVAGPPPRASDRRTSLALSARVADRGAPPPEVRVPPPPSHGGLRALAAFRSALRRVARRALRMGLRALVQRPGRVFATRTHIDVAFDMRRVHLEIRRAGADIDPGWVPWLGRVVTFHYRRGEEPHA